jgi:glycosyltransferase involved in cell wall biosynthesis
MKPLVSILIPAYNSEKWISDTINSALRQKWPNKEIIIVNDGSTDNTFRIAIKFESNIVKVISQENMGACVSRNKALKYSQGDYIQWLDADDLLHPDKISEQLKVAESEKNPRVLFTSSFGTFFFQTQKAKFQPNSLWQDLAPVEWMMTKFNEKVWMNPVTWLVSRKLTELAGPWDNKLTLNDDGEYICRVVSASEKVKFVPEAKCYYRIGNINSLSSDLKRSDQRFQSQLLSIVKQNKCLINMENSERTRSSCIKHLQGDYIDFFPERHDLVKKANEFAKGIGGILDVPDLKWKYKIIQKTIGWGMAKRALFVLPKVKMLIRKYCEKYIAFML